jgi:hypothetical protein
MLRSRGQSCSQEAEASPPCLLAATCHAVHAQSTPTTGSGCWSGAVLIYVVVPGAVPHVGMLAAGVGVDMVLQPSCAPHTPNHVQPCAMCMRWVGIWAGLCHRHGCAVALCHTCVCVCLSGLMAGRAQQCGLGCGYQCCCVVRFVGYAACCCAVLASRRADRLWTEPVTHRHHRMCAQACVRCAPRIHSAGPSACCLSSRGVPCGQPCFRIERPAHGVVSAGRLLSPVHHRRVVRCGGRSTSHQ